MARLISRTKVKPPTIAATAVSTSQINLVATAPTGFSIATYLFQRSPDDSVWTDIASQASASYSATGLSEYTLYYFRVVATDTQGASSVASASVSARTRASAPSAPILTATAITSTRNDLALSGANSLAGIASYTFTVGASAVGPFTLLATQAGSTYSHTGLTPGTTYYYRGFATDSQTPAAVSGFSNVASAGVVNNPPAWSGTPAPSFVLGTAATLSLSAFCADPESDAITYTSVGTALPSGVTINNTDKTLVYSGAGSAGSTTGIVLRATSTGGSADSAQVVVTISNTSPLWTASIPDQDLTTGTTYSLDLDTVCDPDTSTYTVQSGTLPAGLTLSGSVVSGTPTTAGTSVVVFRANDGQSSTALNDWLARSTASTVVWSNGFDSDAEVNAYRWSAQATPGGNDPNAATADASRMYRVPTGGPGGLPCLEILHSGASAAPDVNWWRPLSAMAAPGNGKATSDPGAGKPIRIWTPTFGGSQLANWNFDWYGPQTYQESFYVQIRIKRDPRRVSASYNAAEDIGKQMYLSIAFGATSLTGQEIVLYSGSGGGAGGTTNDFARVYIGGSPAIEQSDTLGRPGQQVGGELSTYPSNYCDVTQNPSKCWSFSGGWDTLLFHVTPGTQTSGLVTSTFRLYAAREGVTTYTKINDLQYTHQWQSASTKGWQAIILNAYQNGSSFPGPFWQRYAQVIFSTAMIPCPQV